MKTGSADLLESLPSGSFSDFKKVVGKHEEVPAIEAWNDKQTELSYEACGGPHANNSEVENYIKALIFDTDKNKRLKSNMQLYLFPSQVTFSDCKSVQKFVFMWFMPHT